MSGSERLVALEGTYNLRDVGGYPAAGGMTRWGKLYRSDSLHALTDADVAELSRRGVKRVIDLRGDDEAAFAPSRLDALDAEIIRNPLLSGPTSDYIARDAALAELYSDIVEREADRLIDAIRHIAGSGDAPVIVHCTAGKDRTGLVVALALDLAGVDRAEIVADYAETERNLPAPLLDDIVERLRVRHVLENPVNLDALVRLSPAAELERVFASIEAEYGSTREYALAHGLAASDIDRLRQALIETR